MKKLILTSALFVSLLTNKFDAQITSCQIWDSLSACNSRNISVSFENGSQVETNPLIQVSWGDGNTSQISNGVYAANQYGVVDFSHEYTTTGTFIIEASIVSSVSGQTIVASPITFQLDELGACGSYYGYLNTPNRCGIPGNYYLNNVIYDITDKNYVTTSFTNQILGLNINNVPYTVSINDDWLLANNLTQTSSDLTISEFDIYGYPSIISPSYFTVASTNTSTLADFYLDYTNGFGLAPRELAKVTFLFGNINCSPNEQVKVNLTFPSGLIPDITDLSNPVISGNILTYDKIISNGYSWEYIEFYMPGTTPAGTYLDFHVEIEDMSGNEVNLANNISDFQIPVYNSYDPNDKLVNKLENIDPLNAEELIYTINFQNEGNADAYKVVVKDTLSSNLDLSTFKVLNSKHNIVTKIDRNTGIVTFTFNDIYLSPKDVDEESSKGYVTYLVKEKENLPVDSEIKNTAYIFFDFNPAIITNTTLNRNTLLSVKELETNNVSVFPNPVSNVLQITSSSSQNDILMHDLKGLKVLEKSVTYSSEINTGNLENGIYVLQVKNEKGISFQRIIVQH